MRTQSVVGVSFWNEGEAAAKPAAKPAPKAAAPAKASAEEIAELMRAVGEVANILGITESGYRCLSNCGSDAHQEVPHLHFHIFGGGKLGSMIQPERQLH